MTIRLMGKGEERSAAQSRRRPGPKPRNRPTAKNHAPAFKAPLSQAETGERSRAALLEVGLELFAQKGFHGTSIRDIARALGISVSTLYHHFAGKEDLWRAILDHEIARLPERLEQAVAEGGDPADRLVRLVRAHLAIAARHPRELRLLLAEHDQPAAPGGHGNRDLQRRVLAIYVGALEELRAAGRLAEGHLKIMAFNILGVINWQLRWLRPNGVLSVDKAQEEIVAFVVRGVSNHDRP